ncbi:phycobiliprotein lyase [Ancylothrix sp. C2]|uniref:phycobiliprotein lyase n=1 Tax=Ancylothrix sp. D3o TaxID=2953691 RepID=UPI0021BB9736|nr:phycobiliprotein lyase [Ancylothrix sp. D3o]MCT7949636.1 phycobiliprotein lyase [Ancylothrix sp. D3o]
MTPISQLSQTTAEAQLREFFRASEGQWRSERRYYTLPDGETQEIESLIKVKFLEAGHEDLIELAAKHQLSEGEVLLCGTRVSWKSHETVSGRKKSAGSTLFGVRGNLLYRDRGFATPKPVTAEYRMPNPQTLCLRTEYNGSVFEEELKQIGYKYRTRQTIISRAGEQQMIGQYLEKRIL